MLTELREHQIYVEGSHLPKAGDLLLRGINTAYPLNISACFLLGLGKVLGSLIAAGHLSLEMRSIKERC